MSQEKQFYESCGAIYDSLNSQEKFQYFIQRRKEILKSLGVVKDSMIVLDLGCGTGIYRDVFSARHLLIGQDFSFSALQRYKSKYPSDCLINADACAIPLKSGCVDLVILFGVIHHMYKQIDVLLSEVKRVLKKGAVLLIDEPNGYNLLWHLFLRSETGRKIDAGLSRPLTPAFLRKKLKAFNFEIYYEKNWGFFPPHIFKPKVFSLLNDYCERLPLKTFSIRFTIAGKSY